MAQHSNWETRRRDGELGKAWDALDSHLKVRRREMGEEPLALKLQRLEALTLNGNEQGNVMICELPVVVVVVEKGVKTSV